ncbi:MAG: type VII secretion protein EccE [Mycobacterium sp.]|nr:type VII secretion protein EccE [Mycobacterium sp.]
MPQRRGLTAQDAGDSGRGPLGEAPPLSVMADPGIYHRFPPSVILPATAIGAATGTVLVAVHAPLAAAIGTGAVMAALCAVRIRGMNIWRSLFMRIELWRRKKNPTGANPGGAAFDTPIPDSDESCGMRWEDGCLITMLQIESSGVTPTLLSPKEIRTPDVVPLDEVARCLSQFDIRLAAIDIVALGTRTRGSHEAVLIYEQVLGPLPATATRTVWVVLRFDPLENTGAIANRGGGTEGTVRTAVIATRRVANRLARHRIRARMLTAAELTAADSAIWLDTDPAEWEESWRALHCGEVEAAGYAIAPDRLTSEELVGIWAVPGASTMMRLRVSRSQMAGDRDERCDRVAVTAIVRHDTIGPVDGRARKVLSTLGLQSLPGVQRRVLLEGGEHTAAVHGVPAALAELTIPSGHCGQVIGSTDDGFGVAVPLFGPGVGRVDIAGGLRLVQQVTVRAMALGARVIVHSSRPQEWARLVEQVGRPEALSVSRPDGGAQHTAAATLIVYDGVTSVGQLPEATVMHVRAPGEMYEPDPAADVTLIESVDVPDQVHIRTAAGEHVVHVVSIPDEWRYLSGEPSVSAQLADTSA